MTKQEVKSEAYEATNGEYVYEGFSAEQWRAIGEENDNDDAFSIAEALDELSS